MATKTTRDDAQAALDGVREFRQHHAAVGAAVDRLEVHAEAVVVLHAAIGELEQRKASLLSEIGLLEDRRTALSGVLADAQRDHAGATALLNEALTGLRNEVTALTEEQADVRAQIDNERRTLEHLRGERERQQKSIDRILTLADQTLSKAQA